MVNWPKPVSLVITRTNIFSTSVFLIAVAAIAITARPPELLRSPTHLGPVLPRSEFVRGLSAGFRQLAADYYWIESLQALSLAKTPDEYLDVYGYAMMIADLDPKFRPIYMFAGVTVPTHDERGRWWNTAESTRVLELGVARFPEYLPLKIVLAYNLANFDEQYQRAADVLREAAKLPGAPTYLSALATRLYSQAGNFDPALALARSVADSAPDPSTRETFERRVKEIQLERILQHLDRLLPLYQRAMGTPARELNDLLRVGLLRSIPQDPLDGTIELGEDGRFHSTAEAHRLELFTGPNL